jgi:two-component system, sensor histidine kinase and response regulator
VGDVVALDLAGSGKRSSTTDRRRDRGIRSAPHSRPRCGRGSSPRGWKQELYRNLLRKFAAGQRQFAATLNVAMGAGDWVTAERIAHTLKGVAGTIGATDVQARAAHLESLIAKREDRSGIDETSASLDTVLTRLIAHLDAEQPIEGTNGEAPDHAMDPEALAEICRSLAGLLSNGDVDGLDLFERYAAQLKAAFPEDFSSLASAIRAYDFEAAANILDKNTASDTQPDERMRRQG